MKKRILLFILLVSCLNITKAAPGDTTWIQAQSDVWLSNFGNYDSTITLPDGSLSYRKIYMVFTLGKYVCPGSPQYCSDWDYTVQNILMTPGGDTVELGRLITPYANSARMTASWKGVYIYDVTDYYPVLKNNATLRVRYSGYSGGFTANVKFAFIEGTPPRQVLGVKNIWKGSFNYGHGATDINTALSNVNLTAPIGTQKAEAKFTVTGHGGDAQNCAEFCPNTYTMNLNNNVLVQKNFWRDNCGFNNYYPQNGTWVFDRAGWCPGDLVNTFHHELSGVGSGSNYALNVTFPAYTSVPSSSGSKASYIINCAVIYYGGFNKTLDVSLEDIIAPTNFEGHFRKNPLAGNPVIRVRNTGSTVVTSLKIKYGLTNGSWMPDHIWTGSIAPLDEAEITLPEPWSLRVATGNNTFSAQILEVNNQQDDDITNDILTSTFTAAPKWPTQLRITLKTNKSVAGGVSETNWKIYDLDGNIVAQRVNNSIDQVYLDTVTLGPAVYKLEVNDAGCDGINWWAYQFYNPNPGTGYFQVRNMTSGIPLNLKGYYNGDFGCGFVQYFTTDWPTGLEELTASDNGTLEVFPNPAQQTVTVTLTGVKNVNGTIKVLDAIGKLVLEKKCTQESVELNVAPFVNGVYNLIYEDAKGKIRTPLLIAR